MEALEVCFGSKADIELRRGQAHDEQADPGAQVSLRG